ncbi:hypothetical protein MKW98_021319 [Papaver atlanticum]|uniref:Uncharacterized protein n=1 Tax=Papaver atlanticum TaxID=357466 RepID=A0AAD4XJC3_9MAGN|nr:hypothetical protein MKW98_021319 [Papaver atlanticum]
MKYQTTTTLMTTFTMSLYFFFFLSCSTNFIVHVSKSQKPSIFTSNHEWYTSTLQSLPHSSHPREILYTYTHVMHGFAARLTPSQASHLLNLPGIVSILPEEIYEPETTRSPAFLGLSENFGLWPNSSYGEDVIIGVLDSGIWPELPSFSDTGLSAVPNRWKGICETGPDFPITSCNRKLIGARAFSKGRGAFNESISPRDTGGHGTHCASIAAGSSVKNAGFYQYAVGEAKGVATRARIAVYKVCWSTGCSTSDILAAMDQAVADGVDVISLSVGSKGDATPYNLHGISIAAFGAMEKGILVSTSAGNAGPGPSTTNKVAPWMLSVEASTIDREFRADFILGDGKIFDGTSLYSSKPYGNSASKLVYAGDIGNEFCNNDFASNSSKVAKNIVLCNSGGGVDRSTKTNMLKKAGGVGLILEEDPTEIWYGLSGVYKTPVVVVDIDTEAAIRKYIKLDRNPTATFKFERTVIGNSPPAPKIAEFSSRGPNNLTPEILKPDVIAPGVNILAGSTKGSYDIKSGTSMACPHVSGLAAMLRQVHRKWSPAAIRSALMTTAYNLDNSGKYISDLSTSKFSTPYEHGSGHVDANRALNPGLVYDIVPDDYVAFLCSIGYTQSQISVFVKGKKIDFGSVALSSPGNLNYPSFSVVFKSGKVDTVKYTRVVKNVGSLVDAVYKARIRNRSPYVKISVSPTKLVFDKNNTSLSYEITFVSSLSNPDTGKHEFGSIEWYDGVHVVRSPIAFRRGMVVLLA